MVGVQKMQLLKTDDGSCTVVHSDHQETYHSKFGALTESDLVYLRNSGVHQRLAHQQPTAILEIGFGTGFNFVHTAQHAIASDCPLSYTAYEIAPLSKCISLQLLSHNAPENPELCRFTADTINRIATGESEVMASFNDQTDLHLICADATSQGLSEDTFDAIYLDAFSAKNNPELWSTSFLEKLRSVAHPHARLATYCVNGRFRAALTDAGFEWRKLPGPKGKREVLVATLAGRKSPSAK